MCFFQVNFLFNINSRHFVLKFEEEVALKYFHIILFY